MSQLASSVLASRVFPSVGDKVRELKVTGFHNLREFFHLSVDCFGSETKTLTAAILDRIAASCPILKTFVIRKCNLDVRPDPFQDHLPGTLETLEFYECR